MLKTTNEYPEVDKLLIQWRLGRGVPYNQIPELKGVVTNEPDSPFDADKRHKETVKPTSPQAAPTPPVASLGRTKSQRRFKGWFMAHRAAIAIFCVMAGFDLLIAYCVFIAMRG